MVYFNSQFKKGNRVFTPSPDSECEKPRRSAAANWRIDLVSRIDVDAIDRERFSQQGFDLAINRRAGRGRVQLRRGADRQPAHLGREIALVRTPDKLIGQPEGADDLGAAWQQGDDSLVVQKRLKTLNR